MPPHSASDQASDPAPVPESVVRLFERPAAEVAVRLPRAQGLAAWRDTLTNRRLVVAAVATPLLFTSYRDAIDGPAPTGLAWTLLLGLVAVLGALVVATYLPERTGTAAGSPCASLAVVYVLLAGMVLDAPADPLYGGLALAMVAFALLQRLRRAAACRPPRR